MEPVKPRWVKERPVREPPIGQVAMWRVKPYKNRALFVRVRVFRSYNTMYAFGRDHCHTGRNWAAMFAPHTRRVYGKKGYEYTIPEFGELLFTLHATTPIIAHECVHAACEYVRRRRPGRVIDVGERVRVTSVRQQQQTFEEWIASCCGYLVYGVIAGWQKRIK